MKVYFLTCNDEVDDLDTNHTCFLVFAFQSLLTMEPSSAIDHDDYEGNEYTSVTRYRRHHINHSVDMTPQAELSHLHQQLAEAMWWYYSSSSGDDTLIGRLVPLRAVTRAFDERGKDNSNFRLVELFTHK